MMAKGRTACKAETGETKTPKTRMAGHGAMLVPALQHRFSDIELEGQSWFPFDGSGYQDIADSIGEPDRDRQAIVEET